MEQACVLGGSHKLLLARYFSTLTAVLSFTELCFCLTVAYSEILEPGGGGGGLGAV
jgi:hypothetical protein